jgi:hypothetical protein
MGSRILKARTRNRTLKPQASPRSSSPEKIYCLSVRTALMLSAADANRGGMANSRVVLHRETLESSPKRTKLPLNTSSFTQRLAQHVLLQLRRHMVAIT